MEGMKDNLWDRTLCGMVLHDILLNKSRYKNRGVNARSTESILLGRRRKDREQRIAKADSVPVVALTLSEFAKYTGQSEKTVAKDWTEKSHNKEGRSQPDEYCSEKDYQKTTSSMSRTPGGCIGHGQKIRGTRTIMRKSNNTYEIDLDNLVDDFDDSLLPEHVNPINLFLNGKLVVVLDYAGFLGLIPSNEVPSYNHLGTETKIDDERKWRGFVKKLKMKGLRNVPITTKVVFDGMLYPNQSIQCLC